MHKTGPYKVSYNLNKTDAVLRGYSHCYTTSHFATLASSQLCFSLGSVSLSNTLITNWKDQADLGNPKWKSHHLALAASSAVTNCGSRNWDPQMLGVDGNSEISRLGLLQCCQSVNVLIEHLFCARCQREYGQDAEKDTMANPLGRRQASRQAVGVHG